MDIEKPEELHWFCVISGFFSSSVFLQILIFFTAVEYPIMCVPHNVPHLSLDSLVDVSVISSLILAIVNRKLCTWMTDETFRYMPETGIARSRGNMCF